MQIRRDETDMLFEALANPTRRALVYRLDEVGAMSLTAAATELTQSAVASDDVDQVVTLLHHQHLPKLAAAGLIEYDREGGAVEANETTATVRQALDAIPVNEPAEDD